MAGTPGVRLPGDFATPIRCMHRRFMDKHDRRLLSSAPPPPPPPPPLPSSLLPPLPLPPPRPPQYAGPGSHIRWLCGNEPLVGPQYSPKLIISLSLGNSVELKVRRRAPGEVPSSLRVDHGDVLEPEYEHCRASGLQGPRVNLTYRWVTQHAASCPPAGVVGLCSPNVCARFSRAEFPLVGPPFDNPGDCPSGQHLHSH